MAKAGEESEVAVKDVQVHGGYVLHEVLHVGTIEGTLSLGDTVTCTIDTNCHIAITETYAFNFALWRALGQADQLWHQEGCDLTSQQRVQ